MPRRRNSGGVTSAFLKVKQQARKLLVSLRTEIRAREAELNRLKLEEASLLKLTGYTAAAGAMHDRGRPSGVRINWRAVLEQLPKRFRAADIRVVRRIKNKRPSEIFAAIARWIEAGIVKRKSRGVYERE
jgi:hypothetical protein